MNGRVYLVGGGPGAIDLYTVKALECIKSADCIIYDRLIDPAILNYCKETCEKIYVGKASNNHTLAQDNINLLLIEKARQYAQVVRLKGGDVYVFGRGGEEALALFKAGIDFEVVPGLTSAVAGLCYAGIPITHRGVSSGFMVVTAHHKNNQAYEWDYQQFLDDSLTYIFMMGQQKLEQIVTNLLVAGKDKTTPIALISNATRTEQRSIYGTLENIIDKFKDNYLCSPMLIVVGAVVALHHELDFFQRKILLNKKILVACVSDQELPISKYFKEQGAAVKQVQLGKVNYLNFQQKLDLNHKLIVFTSQNGIRVFFNYLKMQRVDHRSLTTVRFACIGEKTANLLQLYGYYSDLISPKANSEDFNNYLKNKRMDSEEMIIVRAKEHSKIKKRAEDHELIVYENKELIIVEEESYHLACFTCASSVERLAKYPSTFKIALSIGPMTTQALKKYYPHVKIIEAKDNSYEGMIAIIKENINVL